MPLGDYRGAKNYRGEAGIFLANDNDIRSAPTLSTFKSHIFSHVLTSLTMNSEHCTTPLS